MEMLLGGHTLIEARKKSNRDAVLANPLAGGGYNERVVIGRDLEGFGKKSGSKFFRGSAADRLLELFSYGTLRREHGHPTSA